MNENLKLIVSKIFGTLVRHGLTALGTFLMAKHIGSLSNGTIDNLTEVIVGAICVGGSAIFSVWKSHDSAKTIQDLKQNSPAPAGPSNPIVGMLLMTFLSSYILGCAVIASFDQNSYDSALSIKALSLALMDKANLPASEYATEISALQVRLSAALSYEQGKGKANFESAKQWEILASETHNGLGHFLKDWKDGKTFSPAYLIEKKQLVSDCFDQIIRLEGSKPK